jgi:hypothetical protein
MSFVNVYIHVEACARIPHTNAHNTSSSSIIFMTEKFLQNRFCKNSHKKVHHSFFKKELSLEGQVEEKKN